MRDLRLRSVLACITALLVSCGSSGESSPPTAAGSSAGPDGSAVPAPPEPAPIGGDRPVDVHVPPGYANGVAAPLVVLLHGYGASGALQELYFGLTALSDSRGFLYAHPDGTVDAEERRYWNATDACCRFGTTNVDDAAYVSALITQIKERFTVDPRRVYLVGHSNGGFMAYRMACDHADQIAALVSVAGAMFADVSKCTPSAPVAILQIHGTADATIAFGGGDLAGHAYPSATTTVTDWATLDGCSPKPDESALPLDLDTRLPGAETTVARYATGCRPGGHAELWTIRDGTHLPSLSASFSASVVDFLYAHPKP